MPAWHLRPRSAPEVVDASVQLLRQHARPLLLLGVVLMIPQTIVALVNSLAFGDMITMSKRGVLPTFNGDAALLLLPVAIVGTCWFLVAFTALVGAASAAYVDGTPVDPAAALKRVRPRVGVLLGAGVLTYLLVLVQIAAVMVAFTLVFGVAVGAVALLTRGAAGAAGPSSTLSAGVLGAVVLLGTFGGMLAAAAWLVGRYVSLPAVVINETHGVRATMRRARELSRGSVGRLTGLLLLVGALIMLVSIGGTLLLAGLLGSTVAAGVLISVVNVPLYAFAAVLVAVLYYDLRIRTEGLDIELLARDVAPAPTFAESAPR